MTQEEILEGNKLIAEWLGYEIDSLAEEDEPERYYVYDHIECIADGVDYWETFDQDWTSWLYPDQMKFHSDWNWLMPVVEKIIKEYMTDYYNEYDMGIPNSYYVAIGSDGKYSSQGISKNSLIEATWLSVIEFIKWYNKNKEINE